MFLLRVHLVSVSPKWSGLLVRANFLFVSFPLPFVTTRHDTYIVTRSFLCLFFSFLRPLYYANRLNRTTQTKVVCLVLSCLSTFFVSYYCLYCTYIQLFFFPPFLIVSVSFRGVVVEWAVIGSPPPYTGANSHSRAHVFSY